MTRSKYEPSHVCGPSGIIELPFDLSPRWSFICLQINFAFLNMIDWSKYQSRAFSWKLQPKKSWISSRHYIPRCRTATRRMCATTKTRRATSTPQWSALSITPLTRCFVFSVWKDPTLKLHGSLTPSSDFEVLTSFHLRWWPAWRKLVSMRTR